MSSEYVEQCNFRGRLSGNLCLCSGCFVGPSCGINIADYPAYRYLTQWVFFGLMAILSCLYAWRFLALTLHGAARRTQRAVLAVNGIACTWAAIGYVDSFRCEGWFNVDAAKYTTNPPIILWELGGCLTVRFFMEIESRFNKRTLVWIRALDIFAGTMFVLLPQDWLMPSLSLSFLWFNLLSAVDLIGLAVLALVYSNRVVGTLLNPMGTQVSSEHRASLMQLRLLSRLIVVVVVVEAGIAILFAFPVSMVGLYARFVNLLFILIVESLVLVVMGRLPKQQSGGTATHTGTADRAGAGSGPAAAVARGKKAAGPARAAVAAAEPEVTVAQSSSSGETQRTAAAGTAAGAADGAAAAASSAAGNERTLLADGGAALDVRVPAAYAVAVVAVDVDAKVAPPLPGSVSAD